MAIKNSSEQIRIGIVGLGYVGLPLAMLFDRHYPVIGFDVSAQRVQQLNRGVDLTREVDAESFKQKQRIKFTNEEALLGDCNFFIVTVPTPVDSAMQPDLTHLKEASMLVGRHLKQGDIVVFESTVFPGATREICGQILEEISNLSISGEGRDHESCFTLGYSPERVNPGDKLRTIDNIVKITSGSDVLGAELINKVYKTIIKAGTHQAPSIEVAEAAKVIENIQRDVNVALVNEFALIFQKIGIDTKEILEAACTKWNFLDFSPGLVGGHCIGVDPYYLTHKASQVGYLPELILAGRRINESMSAVVGEQLISLLIKKNLKVDGANILVLGLTFKENCPDIRNSKVFDLVSFLASRGCVVDIHDPWFTENDLQRDLDGVIVSSPVIGKYDAIAVTVAHDLFLQMGLKEIRKFGRKNHVFYDLKGMFDKSLSDGRL